MSDADGDHIADSYPKTEALPLVEADLANVTGNEIQDASGQALVDAVDELNQSRGWFLDFPGSGEKALAAPIVLAGKLGGTLTPGRHVRYTRETPLCNLFVSLLDRIGVKTARFGDSTGPLDRL